MTVNNTFALIPYYLVIYFRNEESFDFFTRKNSISLSSDCVSAEIEIYTFSDAIDSN